mmetsp:Transcript_14002/g.38283  ORF Transcript_14002/g.38283 Transcript_14002/m.38283 type:complete len:209 (+) Transcript_14002:163-789(+)
MRVVLREYSPCDARDAFILGEVGRYEDKLCLGHAEFRAAPTQRLANKTRHGAAHAPLPRDVVRCADHADAAHGDRLVLELRPVPNLHGGVEHVEINHSTARPGRVELVPPLLEPRLGFGQVVSCYTSLGGIKRRELLARRGDPFLRIVPFFLLLVRILAVPAHLEDDRVDLLAVDVLRALVRRVDEEVFCDLFIVIRHRRLRCGFWIQ